MVLSAFIVAAVVTGGPQAQAPAAGRPRIDCSQALADPALGPVCQGLHELQAAETLKDPVERTRRLEAVAATLRRAASGAHDDELRAAALDALARAYDAEHLDQPGGEDSVLRELMGARPGDLDPLFRLARLQERQGFIDAAEATLTTARQLNPDALEPYRELSQFYGRQLRAVEQRRRALEGDPPAPPGRLDDQGVLRIGGGVSAPRKLSDVRPVYPPDARAAGVRGVVIAEILVDETGRVAEARVLRSIPMLDDAALAAVRQWRYTPTLLNGRPVPVRMTVTVNFTGQDGF